MQPVQISSCYSPGAPNVCLLSSKNWMVLEISWNEIFEETPSFLHMCIKFSIRISDGTIPKFYLDSDSDADSYKMFNIDSDSRF